MPQQLDLVPRAYSLEDALAILVRKDERAVLYQICTLYYATDGSLSAICAATRTLSRRAIRVAVLDLQKLGAIPGQRSDLPAEPCWQLEPFAEAWMARTEGVVNWGKMRKWLDPLVSRDGVEAVLAAMRRYLDHTPIRYATLWRFVETYAHWKPGALPGPMGGSRSEQSMTAAEQIARKYGLSGGTEATHHAGDPAPAGGIPLPRVARTDARIVREHVARLRAASSRTSGDELDPDAEQAADAGRVAGRLP